MIDELYESSFTELVNWCKSMTQNQSMAEDLVQEAFLRALVNAELLNELHPAQQKAWMYRTIKNLYVDRVRHASFETYVEQLPELLQEADGYSRVDGEQLLNSLPGDEGVLFSMRYLQGFTSTEIGEFYNLPPGTVRSKLSSARNHLREALGERKR